MAIVGTVIGAGFASGKEIAWFFSRFGVNGIWTSVLIIPLFAIIFIFGLNIKNENLTQKLGRFAPILFFLTNLIFSFAMLSASIFLLQDILYFLPKIVIVIIMLALQLLVLSKGIKGFSRVCSILVPFLVVFLLFSSFNGIIKGENSVLITYELIETFSSVWFCVIYVSANFLLGYTILGKLGTNLTKKHIKVISIISAVIIGFLISVLNLSILSNIYSMSLSMPIFGLLSSLSPVLVKMVEVFVLFAMLTTLFATDQALLEIVNDSKIVSKWSVIKKSLAICLLVLIGAFFNFSEIVENIYPVMGVVGLIIFVIIIIPKKSHPKLGEMEIGQNDDIDEKKNETY